MANATVLASDVILELSTEEVFALQTLLYQYVMNNVPQMTSKLYDLTMQISDALDKAGCDKHA